MLLIGLRVLIGPWLLLDAIDGQVSQWFLWVFAVGVLSDIVDGELLRHQHLSDPRCRSLDSITDAVFYMSVFVCMWFVRPAVIRSHILPITLLLATQWSSWTFCLIRFGRTTSYHSYLAKCWGLTLFIDTINFFTFMRESLLMGAIIVGIASHIEDMLITSILPVWKTDVISIGAAWSLRRDRERRELLLPKKASVRRGWREVVRW